MTATNATRNTPSQPRPSDKFIPWLIVLFFVVLTGVFGGFAYIACKTHPGVVTEQAYEKGLAYDTTIQKAKEQEKMGLTPIIAKKGGTLSFRLTDAQGRAVPLKNTRIWFYRPARAGEDFSADMKRASGTEYTSDATPPEKGQWEVRIHTETDKGPYQATKRFVFE